MGTCPAAAGAVGEMVFLAVAEHWTCKDCGSHFARSGAALPTKDLSWPPGRCQALPGADAAVLNYLLSTSRCSGGQSTGMNLNAHEGSGGD